MAPSYCLADRASELRNLFGIIRNPANPNSTCIVAALVLFEVWLKWIMFWAAPRTNIKVAWITGYTWLVLVLPICTHIFHIFWRTYLSTLSYDSDCFPIARLAHGHPKTLDNFDICEIFSHKSFTWHISRYEICFRTYFCRSLAGGWCSICIIDFQTPKTPNDTCQRICTQCVWADFCCFKAIYFRNFYIFIGVMYRVESYLWFAVRAYIESIWHSSDRRPRCSQHMYWFVWDNEASVGFYLVYLIEHFAVGFCGDCVRPIEQPAQRVDIWSQRNSFQWVLKLLPRFYWFLLNFKHCADLKNTHFWLEIAHYFGRKSVRSEEKCFRVSVIKDAIEKIWLLCQK